MDNQRSCIALVTGANRGLGRSMALHLADRGVDVILTYRTGSEAAEQLAQEISAKGRKAVALQLDVAQSSGFAAFVGAVRATLQATWNRDSIDYLVNNAGIGHHASCAETTEEQFDELFRVHLKAAFFLTQRLLPHLADGGAVLNVSSGLTRFAFPGYGAYAAMKGGVEVLTRYLAKELGPRGIRVNTLAPGAIETDFGGGVVRDNEQVNKGIAAQTALGRVGVPDDIGGAVAMLLSSESHWINGQRVEASGGMML